MYGHVSKIMNIFVVMALFLGLSAKKAEAGGRYALVIGNSNYGGSDDVSGVEDAKMMSALLTSQLGFSVADVAEVEDRVLVDMNTDLDDFGSRIREASVVIFFFSGHGFQNNGENFLMPIGGSVGSSVPLKRVKSALDKAPKEAIKLVFIDACREAKTLAKSQQGFVEEQTPATPGTLYAFAAGPGQTTPGGGPTEVSPYSKALFNYLSEPGIKISELLDKVAGDLTLKGQLPAYVINGVPSTFYLREPVKVPAEISDVNGDLLVLVNGDVILNSKDSTDSKKLLGGQLPLRSGHNDLVLLMSTAKTYHNGHSWDATEGWSYNLKIGLKMAIGGLSCSEPKENVFCYSERGEDAPFKDGPHHGKAFVVATATLVVKGNVDPPQVMLEASDFNVWNTTPPIFAQDQTLLIKRKVKELPLDKILDPNRLPGFGALPGATISVLLRSILTTGKFLDHTIADPDQTFFAVHGNKRLTSFVEKCITEREDELIDGFYASIALAFDRKPTPFAPFDQALNDCVKDLGKDSDVPEADRRVWTAIEDRSGPLVSTRSGVSGLAAAAKLASTSIGSGGSRE